MFLLFFLLWLLLSGGASICTSACGAWLPRRLITWFCRRVLGYDWHILLGDPRKLWAHGTVFCTHLVAEMLKAGMTVMRLVYTKPKAHRAQAHLVPHTTADRPAQGAAVGLHHPDRRDHHRAGGGETGCWCTPWMRRWARGSRTVPSSSGWMKMEESPWSK